MVETEKPADGETPFIVHSSLAFDDQLPALPDSRQTSISETRGAKTETVHLVKRSLSLCYRYARMCFLIGRTYSMSLTKKECEENPNMVLDQPCIDIPKTK